MKTILFALLIAWSSFYVAANEAGSIIGTLKTNNYTIVIANGSSEPVYTVKDSHGAVLAEQLSRLELVSLFPALEELVNTGIADDASLDPRHLPEKS